MTRRALLLGSEIEGLSGVHNDVEAMGEMLVSRGFERPNIDVRTRDKATRDGILAGYQALVDQSSDGDVVVVYYSGHGFYDNEPGQGVWQCIAPTDLRSGTTQDWRGITAWELSLMQQRLTNKTKNATVILDCCHSSQMSRDAATLAAVPRALPHPVRLGFANHLQHLAKTYPVEFAALAPLGNEHAVRLVACAQDTSAYEVPDADGKKRGIFTRTLIEVMREAGDAAVSWLTILDVVRTRVLRTIATQRPDVEGPYRRRMFTLENDDRSGLVRITSTQETFELPTGKLGGDNVGDVYAVLAEGAATHVETAKLEVTAVHATSSHAKLISGVAPAVGALAQPISRETIRRPVAIDAPAKGRTAIEAALAKEPNLRVAGPGDKPLAILRVIDDDLTLADTQGPLFPPAKFSTDLAATLRNVGALATAQGVRELAGTHEVYANEVECEIGTVEGGERRPLPETGAPVSLGNRIYIEVRSTSQRDLYAHVFNIGVRGKVTLLTRAAPAGVLIRQGSPCIVGKNAGNVLTGLAITWPDGLPRESFPRIDEVAVFVTSGPMDLRNLETIVDGTRSIQRNFGKNPLQQLVGQLQDGQTRDALPDDEPSGYFMKLLSWSLHPRDGAIGGVPFAIDQNPDGVAGARSANAWLTPKDAAFVQLAEAPTALAVRLADLIVEDNRAFGSADVRVDALVTTRSTTHGYATWTQKFANVKDGDRLPLDNTLLFHGAVRDFVDITLFVTRDIKDSLDLSQLFAERLNSPELKDALGALLITAGIAATPWVTAVGASAVLTRIAYELLLKVKNKSIGLYRTSFLRNEHFGVGRHPAEATYRAQGFSFSLLIDAVELQ